MQAEATGGEAQNIYRVRGIPNESNFFTLQEDGMLVHVENDGFFFKGDVMIRPDLMTQRIEVVRGGPAPIFADNAAAILNLITRQGGEVAERGVRLTVGDTGLYRFDGFAAGRLADRTYYAFGGFYRKLSLFRDRETDFAQRFNAARRAGDADAAMRAAHDLKGLAGTLGMHALQGAATALERGCLDGARDAEIDAMVHEVSSHLDEVVGELQAIEVEVTHAA